MTPWESQSASSCVLPQPPPRPVPFWSFLRRARGLFATMLILGILGLVLMITLFTAFFLVGGSRVPWGDNVIDREGEIVQGTLVETRFMKNTRINNRRPWKVSFLFEDGIGGEHTGQGYTFSPDIGNLPPGAPLDLEVVAARPHLARPRGGSFALFPLWAYLMVIGLTLPELIIAGVLKILLMRQIRVDRALLSGGTAVAATVTGRRTIKKIRINQSSPVDIYYTFADELGRKITAHDRTYLSGWGNSLREGDRVAVVYHPRRPELNVLYPVEEG